MTIMSNTKTYTHSHSKCSNHNTKQVVNSTSIIAIMEVEFTTCLLFGKWSMAAGPYNTSMTISGSVMPVAAGIAIPSQK